jgi:hypothetical protein
MVRIQKIERSPGCGSMTPRSPPTYRVKNWLQAVSEFAHNGFKEIKQFATSHFVSHDARGQESWIA